jgi:hypothetical protein
MKLLKILICELVLFSFLTVHVSAGNISTRFGFFDFTDEVTSEFYKITPVFLFSYDVVQISYMKINVSAGVSQHNLQYNSKDHHVGMYPANISFVYQLPDWRTRLYPYFGGGLSGIYKVDKNEWFQTPHKSFSYGYHFLFGIYHPIFKRWSLGINFQYNFLHTSNVESVDLSGALPSLELRYNFNKLLKLE